MTQSTAIHVRDISVMDPDRNVPVEMSVFKHQLGGMFAIDFSFLDQVEDDVLPDMFNPGETMHLVYRDHYSPPSSDVNVRAGMIAEAIQMGFTVREDSDEPGMHYFAFPHGYESELKFTSAKDAWDQVIAELPAYKEAELKQQIETAKAMGFEVREASDQSGMYYFMDPHGNGSDISFPSAKEAWDRVIAEIPSYEEVEAENEASDREAALKKAGEMGFNVHPDPEQPEKFYVVDPNGARLDTRFDSLSEAWDAVIAEMPEYAALKAEEELA